MEIFEKFEEEIGKDKEPYRTEWMVWDDELKFAGSIDMIYRNPDGTLDIYDWKRSVGIKMDNQWQVIDRMYKHLQIVIIIIIVCN